MASQADIFALAELLGQNQREQMPWERVTTTPAYDMFGSAEDNPLVRRARELEHDRALASETFNARAAAPRAWETPQSIAAEVFSPLAATYGGDFEFPQRGRATVRQNPDVIKAGAGSTILKPNPLTGQMEEVWSANGMTEGELNQEKLKDLRSQRNALIRTRPNLGVGLKEWEAQLKTINDAIDSLEQSLLPQKVEAPTNLGSGFIGSPGGSNAFENPFERGLKLGSVTGEGAKKSGLKILNIRKR